MVYAHWEVTLEQTGHCQVETYQIGKLNTIIHTWSVGQAGEAAESGQAGPTPAALPAQERPLVVVVAGVEGADALTLQDLILALSEARAQHT